MLDVQLQRDYELHGSMREHKKKVCQKNGELFLGKQRKHGLLLRLMHIRPRGQSSLCFRQVPRTTDLT